MAIDNTTPITNAARIHGPARRRGASSRTRRARPQSYVSGANRLGPILVVRFDRRRVAVVVDEFVGCWRPERRRIRLVTRFRPSSGERRRVSCRRRRSQPHRRRRQRSGGGRRRRIGRALRRARRRRALGRGRRRNGWTRRGNRTRERRVRHRNARAGRRRASRRRGTRRRHIARRPRRGRARRRWAHAARSRRRRRGWRELAFELADRRLERRLFARDVGFGKGRPKRPQLAHQRLAGPIIDRLAGRLRPRLRQVGNGLGQQGVVVSHPWVRSSTRPQRIEKG